MSDETMGGPRPNSSRNMIRARQLTIGECAAIARYGPIFADADTGRTDLAQLLAFLDRAAVCTTCGWSKAVHDAEEGCEHRGISCQHYERHL